MNSTTLHTKTVYIALSDVELTGDLTIPETPRGLIIFSHGSGSSRHSKRNKAVATVLQEHSFATLLFDLLTEKEDEDYEKRFDIDLLTKRLKETTDWVIKQPSTSNLPIGYFGASTGAASALRAAVQVPDKVKAIVSRGGRPDLAMEIAERIAVPTLLIVGSLDKAVLSMNQGVYIKLLCTKELAIIDGATHLFPELGKLEEVANLATAWFEEYL